jgi:hypothetical protein
MKFGILEFWKNGEKEKQFVFWMNSWDSLAVTQVGS